VKRWGHAEQSRISTNAGAAHEELFRHKSIELSPEVGLQG
jgi:hypothetical protein